MSIVQEIRCSTCGAPIKFSPGEIIATCAYCGFTQVIETGKAFVFDHSLIVNEYSPEQVDEMVQNWMKSGFVKPGNMAKASKILERNLLYLPFWLIPITATTDYKGIFERLTPPVVKEGKIEKKYNWLVLGRKATDFPTREYDVPLEGKIPYDFKRIEGYAKVLNSEIERDDALDVARQQIEESHRFLIKQDIDRVIEVKTDFETSESVYLHAPVWRIVYEYKDGRYGIWLDGATGAIIQGDIPAASFGLI
jgi:DNA-directed RNA polymerase subunit RPC12/RpoP